MRTRLLLGVALVAALLLTGCSNSVTATLQGIIIAGEALADTLAGNNTITPAVARDLDRWLGATSDAVTFTTEELASGDTTQVKAAKIAQAFASIAAPNLPSGTPQTIVSVVAAVSKAVLNFLGTVQATQAVLTAHPEYANSFADTKAKMPSKSDKKLAEIKARAAKLKARIKKP